MTQIWRNKKIHPEFVYDSNFKSSFWWGCDDGFTSLPVLINHCQNIIISKFLTDVNDVIFHHDPTYGDMRINYIKVYVNKKVFDLFIDTMTFNYKEYFTIEMDETVQNDMIMISSLNQKYIEAVKIM